MGKLHLGWIRNGLCCAAAWLLASALAAQEIELLGRVLTGAGEPLHGATVELLPYPGVYEEARRQLAGEPRRAVARVETGRDGRYLLAAPEAGAWTVAVRRRGHLPALHPLLPLVEPRTVPALRLLDGGEVRIRVRDAEGRPAAGARLQVLSFSARWQALRRDEWHPEPAWPVTGDDGRATAAAGADGHLRVAAVHGGRYGFATGGERGDVELILDRRLERVRLLAATGGPAAGLHAVLRGIGLALDVSGDDGEVLLPQDPRAHVVFADREGVYMPDGGIEEEDGVRVLRLRAASVLAGRVVDATEETGLAGAVLWGAEIGTVRCGRGGSFRLRLAPVESTYLRLAAPGYLVEELDVSPARLASGEELTIALRAALRLRGRVVDEGGRGVAGAEVRVAAGIQTRYSRSGTRRGGPPPSARPQTVTSRADGTFEVTGLVAGLRYTLEARGAGYGPTRTELELAASGLDEETVLTLRPGLRAFGQVLAADGRPVAGAEVSLGSPGDESQPFETRRVPRTVTDGEGRFQFPELAPGTVELRAEAAGYTPARMGLELAAEDATEAAIDLGTVTLAPGVTLHGRVSDADGKPLAGARISAGGTNGSGSWHTETRGDGTFVLAELPRSELFLSVTRDGYRSLSMQRMVPDPDQPLSLVLEPAVVLAGVVVDADGTPVRRTNVQLHREMPGGGGSGYGTTTNAAGRFEFADESPGKVTVSARGETGVAGPVEVTLKVGQEPAELRLVLRRGGGVRGRVLDAAGAGVAEAQVLVHAQPAGRVQPGSFPNSAIGTSDAAGRFELAGLDVGTYDMEVNHPDYLRATRTVTVAEGADPVEVVLERRARPRVAGQVIAAEGTAVSGATVRLAYPRRMSIRAEAVSRTSGAFEILAPEAGDYVLLAEHPEHGSHRAELRVEPEGVAGLVLELDRGGTIYGRILGAPEEDLPRLRVSASLNRTALTRQGIVADDGTYRVTGLSAGEWVVSAVLGETWTHDNVTVGAGDSVAFDVRFPAGYRLRGKVLADGNPLANARLYLTCRPSGRHYDATTRGDGRFELSRIEAGTCQVTVAGPDGVTGRRQVEVTADAEVLLELRSSGLSGAVVAAGTSQPVAGAAVELRAAEGNAWRPALGGATTDAAGRFTLGVEEGTWELRLKAAGFMDRRQRVEVPPGGADVELAMVAAVTAEVYVTTADGEVPRHLSVAITAGPQAGIAHGFRPGPNGRVVVDTLGPGTWRLGLGDGEGNSAEIELEVPGAPVRVVLERGDR